MAPVAWTTQLRYLMQAGNQLGIERDVSTPLTFSRVSRSMWMTHRFRYTCTTLPSRPCTVHGVGHNLYSYFLQYACSTVLVGLLPCHAACRWQMDRGQQRCRRLALFLGTSPLTAMLVDHKNSDCMATASRGTRTLYEPRTTSTSSSFLTGTAPTCKTKQQSSPDPQTPAYFIMSAPEV
jgi:hypothetical protein